MKYETIADNNIKPDYAYPSYNDNFTLQHLVTLLGPICREGFSNFTIEI